MTPREESATDLAADIEKRLFTLRQKLAKAPQDPVLHNQMGLTQGAARRMKDALQAFNQALALCPTYGEAHMNRGLALEMMGRAGEAGAAYAAAATLTPHYSEAILRAQQVAMQTGQAVAMRSWPEPRRGVIARLKDRLAGPASTLDDHSPSTTESEERNELDADRGNFRSAFHLGVLLGRQSRYVEAEHFLRYALRGVPALAAAAISLAEMLEILGRVPEGVAVVTAVMKAGAHDARLAPLLLRLKQGICDWDGYDALKNKTIAAIRQTPSCSEPLPVMSISDEPADHLACAQAYSALVIRRAEPVPRYRQSAKKDGLTVGYISPDFHQHAGATLFAELFGLHDRSRFKVIGYALWTDDGGVLRRRIRKGCDRLVDMWGISARQGAAQISADNVNILVDLTGYARNARPDILAHRPAPIQVNYLGYPGTLGAAFVDYAIVDPIVAPPGDEQWFTEKLVRLPHAYQINDRERPTPEPHGTRSDYGLPEAGVVFCNFNGNSKFTPVVFDSWMRILRGVPGSVLWLYTGSEDTVDNLRREAERRGVVPARLVFARSAPYVDHIARYALADLFLDTLPYTAHTTASESLWMGCPLLTCMGRAFPGRVAASLLTAAGYPELITHSPAEYESVAIKLGNNPARLAALRDALTKTRATCHLFDTPAVVKQLEAAYTRMWDAHMAGKPPEGFAVH